MCVVLIPIIKDQKAKTSSIANYRPVAIASVVLKVLERIFRDRLSEYLDAIRNQFGFKPKLGTDMCIYSLKEIIDSYSQLNGCVFSCFLEASKAFDRVNTLCYLLNREDGAPTDIYIYIYIYRKIAHVLVCASDNVR